MQTEEIQINNTAVDQDAESISGIAEYLKERPLYESDGKSTINAVMRNRAAYQNSQLVLSRLGRMLEDEADKIRSMGLNFLEVDEMEAQLIESNIRIQ